MALREKASSRGGEAVMASPSGFGRRRSFKHGRAKDWDVPASGDGMGAIGKTSFKHGYAKHWDVPVSPESSPVGGTEGVGTTSPPPRDVFASIDAIGALAKRDGVNEKAVEREITTTRKSEDAPKERVFEYDFDWREKEREVEVPVASFDAKPSSPNFSEASFATPTKATSKPRGEERAAAMKEDSWSFPVVGGETRGAISGEGETRRRRVDGFAAERQSPARHPSSLVALAAAHAARIANSSEFSRERAHA